MLPRGPAHRRDSFQLSFRTLPCPGHPPGEKFRPDPVLVGQPTRFVHTYIAEGVIAIRDRPKSKTMYSHATRKSPAPTLAWGTCFPAPRVLTLHTLHRVQNPLTPGHHAGCSGTLLHSSQQRPPFSRFLNTPAPSCRLLHDDCSEKPNPRPIPRCTTPPPVRRPAQPAAAPLTLYSGLSRCSTIRHPTQTKSHPRP